MPYIQINGADIYYETFGKQVPGRAPVVLIHGSTGTGRSNWSLVAPLLAREYQVIVPDCRGHGKSSNPGRSYRFKEMAADTAALIRALGFPRAHVIGHSNGGNVALVTLLEHPEVVQTAIPQAANAWVSPDLVEKEPPLFDPDRVASESPGWMNEMVALHGETHGPEYWRDLLSWTVQELIHEPNYTPTDLAQVRRPTLVIQGENDGVNAPFKHAQFIARYIPQAELWMPAGIGHTVHDEILFDWVDKVLDFLARRGTDENDAIYRLGRVFYRDERDTIFRVKAALPATPEPGSNVGVKLTGQVLTGDQLQAIRDLFPASAVEAEIQVLLNEETPWALVNRNVTDLRREPRNLSERLDQALLGEAVRVLESGEEWIRVRLERDGYLGWMQGGALYRCQRSEVESYQQSCDYLVSANLASAYASPAIRGSQDVEQAGAPAAAGVLPFGVAVPARERIGEWVEICKPDGTCWWVHAADLLPLAHRPGPDADGISGSLQHIRRWIGTPYLWGGRTPFGCDCSGLSQAFWGFMGIQLPRDSNQQIQTGSAVDGGYQPGDLLFFGEAREAELLPGETGAPPRPITHVAISLGGDEVIHSNGSAWGVSYNSLAPTSPLYRAWLKNNLAGARRYA